MSYEEPHLDLRLQVRELVETWRALGRYEPRCDSWLRGFDPAFSKELAARGLIGITWPREYGGQGLPNTARLAVSEELLRAGAPVAAHWIGDRQIGPAILRHGSERLRNEILPGIITAQSVFCLGMSEPEAGSDLAALRTSAEWVEGAWKLRGRKVWTSAAHHATHAYVLARTERCERKQQGLTEFVVDMDSPGIEVSPIVDISGEHHFNEVSFDDVVVPDHRVLGEVGNGWSQVIEQLSFERGGPERFMTTYPLLADLLATPDLPADVMVEVGTLVARLRMLRGLAWQVAHALDADRAPIQEAATLKYLGNAFEHDLLETARRGLRDSGRVPHEALVQAVLASPGYSVRGGAAEVLLSLIARAEAS